MDVEGNIVHEWKTPLNELFPDSIQVRGGAPDGQVLHGTRLLPDGDVVVNVEYIGTARLDACGDVVWQLPAGTHHSIEQGDDGSFWIPGTSSKRQNSSRKYPDGFPGLEKPVWLDQILKVSTDGRILKKINVLDIIYQNGLERYIPKKYQPEAGADSPDKVDLTHLNDIEVLQPQKSSEYPLFDSGDILVSLRDIHLVFVFDPQSLDVKWHASVPFIQQHDPDFLSDGWVGIFDNNEDFTKRGDMLGGSRIVTIKPQIDSVEILFPTKRSDPFYTDLRGKWESLPNGNMLLTEAQTGRIVEVTPEGETVWEWIHQPYDHSQVAAVTKASRHDLTRTEIATWPCASVDSSYVSN